MTSVDNRLFVLRAPSHQRIQVYDLETFTLQQQTLEVKGLTDWGCNNGLTACVITKCLYVSDCRNAAVYQVELTVDNKIFKWSVGSGPRGLSINTANNLLVACYWNNKIQEYDTVSKSLVREIYLTSHHGEVMRPFHVIQMNSDQFVVSCDTGQWSCDKDVVNTINGVSDVIEVDINGQTVVSYKRQLQSTTKENFSEPRHLAVDRNSECVFVADTSNNRIVILSRSVNCFAREFRVMSVDGGLQLPSCLHFDDSKGRLFVGETDRNNKSQRRVLVFDNVINIANRSQ